MIAPLAALALTAGPCADPALLAARLSASTTEAEFSLQLTAAEESLGTRLLLLDELARPLGERTALATARAGTACAWLQRPTGGVESPLEPLAAVLDRPVFSGARDRAPHAFGQAWERLKAWVLSLLEDRTTNTLASGIRWLVLGLAATLAGAALWRTWARRRAGDEASAGPPAPVLSRLSPPTDHLRAARASLPGDPRGALREGLLALLSGLERAGWLSAGRTLTNRELSSAIADRPGADEAGALLRGFDRRYYSLERVGAEDAARFLSSVESACARMPRGEG